MCHFSLLLPALKLVVASTGLRGAGERGAGRWIAAAPPAGVPDADRKWRGVGCATATGERDRGMNAE